MLLKISKNSQESTCARVSFLVKLLKKILWHRCFAVNCRIFKKTSFHRTPPVAASVTKKNLTQQASTCSKLAINEINVQGAALDLFKVHNKNSRTTSFDVP